MTLGFRFPLILAAAGLCLACGSSAPSEGPAATEAADEPPIARPVPSDEEMAGDWVLVALGEEMDPEPSITLAVDPVEGRISGRSACNRYFTAWAPVDGRVEIGVIGSTQMACPDPVAELESQYLQALEEVTGYRMAAGELELTGEEGDILLRFARAEPDAE